MGERVLLRYRNGIRRLQLGYRCGVMGVAMQKQTAQYNFDEFTSNYCADCRGSRW